MESTELNAYGPVFMSDYFDNKFIRSEGIRFSPAPPEN